MYVADDLTVTERFHGVSQNIPAHGLHDVLDEFGTVTLDPGPVLCGVYPHVGDGLSSESVLTDLRLHVSKPPAGGQRDEEHSAVEFKTHQADSL